MAGNDQAVTAGSPSIRFVGVCLVTAYLFFLFWLLPARVLSHFVEGRDAGVLGRLHLAVVAGTWRAGNAHELRLGRIVCRDLDWRLAPADLLRGRLTVQLHGVDEDGGECRADISLKKGELSGRDLRFSVPAEMVRDFLGPAVGASGRISVELSSALLVGKYLQEASGTVRWQKARLTSPLKVDFGSLRIDLATDASGMTGRLRDEGQGAFSVSGAVQIAQDGLCQVEALLSVRSEADPATARLLGLLGRPDEQGRVRVAFSGVLPGL